MAKLKWESYGDGYNWSATHPTLGKVVISRSRKKPTIYVGMVVPWFGDPTVIAHASTLATCKTIVERD